MTVARGPLRFNVGLRRLSAKQAPYIITTTRDARTAFKALENKMRAFNQMALQASEGAVNAALTPIYERSQELVPVKTGALKESGFVDVQTTRKGVVGEVGYSPRGDPFYGVLVHELVELAHADPTSAKFLQRAIEELSDKIGRTLQDYLRLS